MSSNKELEQQDFEMANNLDFYVACTDFLDGVKPLQNNPVQTIGDRMRLIKCLRDKGFIITQPTATEEADFRFKLETEYLTDKEFVLPATEDKSIEQEIDNAYANYCRTQPHGAIIYSHFEAGYKANTVNADLKQSHSELQKRTERLIEIAKKVLQYPKGSKGYDPVDAINLHAAISKAEQLKQ